MPVLAGRLVDFLFTAVTAKQAEKASEINCRQKMQDPVCD